eukprot:2819285-Amphidinium_carterae.1
MEQKVRDRPHLTSSEVQLFQAVQLAYAPTPCLSSEPSCDICGFCWLFSQACSAIPLVGLVTIPSHQLSSIPVAPHRVRNVAMT